MTVPQTARYEVVVPTRNRPDRLERCLASIARARGDLDLPVLIADASDDEGHGKTLALAARHPFARVERHGGTNVSMARNFCAEASRREVLISVDDDTQVEPDALEQMIAAYERSPKPCAVAGATAWDGVSCEPLAMRYIGYGRALRPGEKPSFLVSALFAFPRQLALTLPWNTRLRRADDIYIGSLWRGHGVNLCFAPEARSIHDPIRSDYGAEREDSMIYVNLCDALFANPDWRRVVTYELLGFAAAARLHFHSLRTARRFVASWIEGNLNVYRDRSYLRELTRRELPASLRE